MTQAASRPPVDLVCRALPEKKMKIPEPIIDPTTIMVESNKPRPRTNPDDSVSVMTSLTSRVFGSDIAPLLFRSTDFSLCGVDLCLSRAQNSNQNHTD